MKSSKWDKYFHTRYKPVEGAWGERDLLKYRKWYQTWIPYLLGTIPDNVNFVGKDGLEIGAGIGAVSSLLQDRGIHMTASDVSNEMVVIGKNTLKDIEYIYLDILNLPKKISTYDLIIGIEVLEHVDNLSTALHSLDKLLNKGGWFIGTTPYPYEKNMSDPTHVNVHEPSFWKELFIEKGFCDVRITPLSSFPFLWKIHPMLNVLFFR